tara:strand:- start:1537 stop:2082 length:546 start_codon:yes stop_codon:yes gene_type:complete
MPSLDDPYFGYTENKNNSYADQAAKLTRNQYIKNKANSDIRLNKLISSGTGGTDIIDQAKEDVENAIGINKGVQQRNVERYGVDVNPAVKNAQDSATRRMSTLATVGSENNARLAQFEQNANRLKGAASAIDASYNQGIGSLTSAANMQSARTRQYKMDKAQNKSMWTGMAVSALSFAAML